MNNFYNIFLKDPLPLEWSWSFQKSVTPIMDGIHFFHNELVYIIIIIACSVGITILMIIYYFNNHKKVLYYHDISLEIIWTLLPAVLLLYLSIPSFSLLYTIDEVVKPALTLKVIGHQWYWSYEYSDNFSSIRTNNDSIEFDSYMLPLEDLEKGQLRLLEVDNRATLPINTPIRILVTSSDVLHSFAIPSFGLKIDACPGRLNQTSLFILEPGTFYGQCSEICGINHGFMPIVCEGLILNDFYNWINKQ